MYLTFGFDEVMYWWEDVVLSSTCYQHTKLLAVTHHYVPPTFVVAMRVATLLFWYLLAIYVTWASWLAVCQL